MNIKYAVAASLLLSVSAFAQKDELKALKKLNEKETTLTAEERQKYGTLLTDAESKLGAATPEQKADFYYYKAAQSNLQMADPAFVKDAKTSMTVMTAAYDDYSKVLEMEKDGKKNHTKQIQEVGLGQLKTNVLNLANGFSTQKMYKEASEFYELAYKIDPKDPANLYNAAAMAVNTQNYDAALKDYLELDRVGFTGEGTVYRAKNVKTGEVEYFPSPTTMKIAVDTKAYTDPQTEKLPSLKGDIVKNIALIYVQKGEVDKAKQAMANARKGNPEDASLIVEEANLYYKTNDMVNYKRLINEAIQKSPNDPVLFFNLGVVSTANSVTEAEQFYKKALELKPDYFDALINIGLLQINGEKKVVDEMNKLGNTAKDNQRFDVLKKQKDAMYVKALPYLEKAHQVKPDDMYVISVLAGMYQALERTADYKAMKAKVKS